ncbi:peptidylprolyl isomerase [Blastopirellula marina]|uniref:Peptidyl-prolyl cis-trans isomerase n=1 Tax=Blastopirellula marina TaxID=124 RepID=A0A2S8G316_9BACT|nr:peptidylprolyl isomerase [Blastopirellula marina]PQO38534.1 peptidylprolyl isomerase [Blastopirellula marina]PTL45191.1 peptidylprolyl isomerase [Blastopirellula marina]
MKVAKNTVVSIAYTLKDVDGNVLDTADADAPLAYLHGFGNLIAGMEKALDNRDAGESFEVVIPPEEAYGSFDDDLVWELDKDQFGELGEVEIGTQFVLETEDDQVLVTVAEIKDDVVIVDGNHELADETLFFEISVVDVREATPEEIEHGHAHGPGGAHDHDHD